MIAFLEALAAPYVDTHQDLLRYRGAKVYHLKITPQVCYLEQLLNSRYDRSLRRIHITDGNDRPPMFIYRTAELRPVFIRSRIEAQPAWLYTRGENINELDDFIVWVPDALITIIQEEELIGLVKAYKLAGTKFKVQTY